MQLRCRLHEIMAARGIKFDELQKKTRVDRNALSALRKNTWNSINRRNLAALCAALDVRLDELFELIPEDIWAPIKMRREVTIHYGSRAIMETAQPGRAGEKTQVRQFIGVWDRRACKLISECLHQSCPDIRVREVEHITGQHGFDPDVDESALRVFREGNHVLVGSPIANGFVEQVVCGAYDVAPGTPKMRGTFPYGFVWEPGHGVRSSFGWDGVGNDFGIWSNLTGKLVASRTFETDGEGQDCALILVYRIASPTANHGSAWTDAERVIIAILGHSGPGTYAATQLAVDESSAVGLFPSAAGKPLMRAVRSTYSCSPVTPPRDNRQVTSRELVDEPDDGSPTAATAKPGKKPRRRKKKGG